MAHPGIRSSNIQLGRRITREQIITRAESWLFPPVPYSRTEFHENEYGTYRTDCSGYVSMAWGIPGRPPNIHGGLDTVGLALAGSPIGRQQLRAGDVVLNSIGTHLTRHVVLFVRWASADQAAYCGYEQAAGHGTRFRTFPYPHEISPGHYLPYRYLLVVD